MHPRAINEKRVARHRIKRIKLKKRFQEHRNTARVPESAVMGCASCDKLGVIYIMSQIASKLKSS